MTRYKGRPTKRQLALLLGFLAIASYSSYWCSGEANDPLQRQLIAL